MPNNVEHVEELEAAILKSVAICMRNRKVITQFLIESAGHNKDVFFVVDIAKEKLL